MDKIEELKFIINRYDQYIESAQTKSNLYIILNTFILGGSITLLTSISAIKFTILLYVVTFCIILLCTISLVITLYAIDPYLKSSDKSVIFFGDASQASLSKYKEKISLLTSIEFTTDLVIQAHCLATGLTNKYKKLKWVGRQLIFQFFLIIIWGILFILKKN